VTNDRKIFKYGTISYKLEMIIVKLVEEILKIGRSINTQWDAP